jgi:DNA repair protein RadC
MKTCTVNGNSQHNQSPRENIYALPRFRVSLVRENCAAAPSLPIATSVTAAALLAPCFKGIDREQFVICGLDAKHRIIGLNIVSVGSLTFSIVHPREVFKPLILMNACAALCAHNHPSGDPDPSSEDRALTARRRQAGELLGITLLDHIILGDDRHLQLRRPLLALRLTQRYCCALRKPAPARFSPRSLHRAACRSSLHRKTSFPAGQHPFPRVSHCPFCPVLNRSRRLAGRAARSTACPHQ